MAIGSFVHLITHVAIMKEIVTVIVNVIVDSNVGHGTALHLLALDITLLTVATTKAY